MLSAYVNFHFRNESFLHSFLRDSTLKNGVREGELFGIKQSRNNFLYCSSMKKSSFPRIRIMRRVTFKFEYLGEFEFIFENKLRYETGSQMGSTDDIKKLR